MFGALCSLSAAAGGFSVPSGPLSFFEWSARARLAAHRPRHCRARRDPCVSN